MAKIEKAKGVSPLPAAAPWIAPSVSLFLLLFAFWQLNSGHSEGWLIALGVASCALVVWLARRLDLVDAEGVPVHLVARGVSYLPWLVVEIVKANLDVARSILTGSPTVDPCVFHVRASQSSELGRVVYANSITLTPGTVTIDVAEDGMLTVHALTLAGRQGVESGEMDSRVCRLMGEA